MHQVITATYENGALKPLQTLPLEEQQQVLLIVVPMSTPRQTHQPELQRVATMQAQVDTWLKLQAPNAVRLPLQLSEQSSVGAEAAIILSEIHAAANQIDPTELIADIEAALAEVQALSPQEKHLLDAELEAML